MGRMFNPPHPGEMLREDVLPELGLTVTEAARQLGVSRKHLSNVLNAKVPISVDLAQRLEDWLGIDRGGRAELWLSAQIDYDLWQLRKQRRSRVERARA